MECLSRAALIIAAFSAGCSSTSSTTRDTSSGGAAQATPAPTQNTVKRDAREGQLLLLSPGGSDNYDRLAYLAPIYADANARKMVLGECDASNAPPPQKTLAVFGTAIGIIFDWALNWGTQEVQKELKEYTGGYQVSASGEFYKVIYAPNSNDAQEGRDAFAKRPLPTPNPKQPQAATTKQQGPHGPDLDQAIKCIRVVRFGKDGKTPEVDFIGEVKLADNKEYFQIRPLSLYFSNPSVNGDPVAISLELAINSTWFEKNRGFSEKVVDTVVVSERYSRQDTSQKSVKYFFDPAATGGAQFFDWSHYRTIPLPPYSIDERGTLISERGKTSDLAGLVELTATISEVGKAPAWLTDLAGFLTSEGKNVSKGLTSAVDTELGIKPSSSSGSTGSQ